MHGQRCWLQKCDDLTIVIEDFDLRINLRFHVIGDQELHGLSSGDGVLECGYPVIDEDMTDLFGLLPSLERNVRTSSQDQFLGALLIEGCRYSNGARVYVGVEPRCWPAIACSLASMASACSLGSMLIYAIRAVFINRVRSFATSSGVSGERHR